MPLNYGVLSSNTDKYRRACAAIEAIRLKHYKRAGGSDATVTVSVFGVNEGA